jgi:hypothetical protein
MGFTAFFGLAVLGTAAAMGILMGRKRPLFGALAALGVIFTAVAGFCLLFEFSDM